MAPDTEDLDAEHAALLAEHAELQAEHRRLEGGAGDLEAHRRHNERLVAHVARLHRYMEARGFQPIPPRRKRHGRRGD